MFRSRYYAKKDRPISCCSANVSAASHRQQTAHSFVRPVDLQVGLPALYGIQVQDMEYYLSFALVIIFFQLCVDVFIHGVLELFHGWKIYDYLVSQPGYVERTNTFELQASPCTLFTIKPNDCFFCCVHQVYTRYRFLQRETRWKGLEDSLDECIDESMRTLDQVRG